MNYLCRLCSSSNNLVDVFHYKVENGRQLRHCILLASGIDIKKDDLTSTMVCLRCCEIAVKLHKYRINAINNDLLLKKKCGQRYIPPVMDPNELTKAAAQIDAYVNNEFQHKDSSVLLNSATCKNYFKIKAKVKKTINKNFSNIAPNIDKLVPDETIVLKNINLKSDNNSDISKAPAQVSSIPTVRVINKHNSVKKLLSIYKDIILPEEINCDDVSPLVLLDENDVNEWYANHKRIPEESNDTLRNSSVSFTVSESSNDSDTNVLHSRLRKRTNRRIIIDSDSEDEVERSRKCLRSSKTASVSLPKTNEILENTVTVPTVSSLGTTPLAQSNLNNLFTDFNKYGINFENSEPPIEMCGTEESSFLIVDKNSDVICLTDEQPPNTTINADNNTYLEVKSLFENHYVFNYKPKNTAILLTQKGIVLQNMAPELKKYYIPVELEHSWIPQARVLKRNSQVTQKSNDINLWSYKDCTDIVKPTGQTVHINPVASVNHTQPNLSNLNINITEQNKSAGNVINGSVLTNIQKIQSMIITKPGPLTKKKMYTIASITPASTASSQAGSNNANVYNMISINENRSTTSSDVLSNTNNVYITRDTMPPLIPISTLPTVIPSIIPTSTNSTNGTDDSNLQVRHFLSPTLAATNKPYKTGLTQIRKILPKTDDNLADKVFKTWHQVQNPQPPKLLEQTLSQQTPTQVIGTLPHQQQTLQQQYAVVEQQSLQHTPGAIRVKSLSELVKN